MGKDDVIKNHKTMCCNSSWYVKSRANFRCKKCDKDVTLEVVFLYTFINE